MIVFKAFLSVLNKNKAPVILFTVMLVVFGALNFSNNENSVDFTSTKPDVLIVNEDVNDGVTKAFISYIGDNSNIIELKNEEIDDALFYRNVNYVIYIPGGFRDSILNGNVPEISIKSTGDYQASFAEMMVSRYLRLLSVYNDFVESEDELISFVNSTLSTEVQVEVTSKLDSSSLSRMIAYFNFMNYAMLAGLVYVISIVLSSFKNSNIMKRTVISSMNYKRFNRYLLLSNGLFAFVLWLIYMIMSYVLLGNVLISSHGVVCVLNSFVFMLVALTVAMFIGNLISSKNAVNGIVNVIALGSSFLCGAFVPVEFMPKSVVNIGKVLPSYYYINSNEIVKTLEVVNLQSLLPIIYNSLIMGAFIVVFVILMNVVSNRKRKLG